MNNNNALQQILDKFEYIDLEKVYEKIKQFKIGGKGLLHVVSDFDHTLTAGKTAASISNSWGAIDSLLPKEAVRKHQEYYSELRPLEISGRLTNDFAAEYWTKVLDLITSYPLQEKDLKDAFLSSAKLRSGVVETFSLCERNNVPVIILSSGIRNIIDEVFDYYGVKPDYVFSNKLVVDENGMINSWDRDSLIHNEPSPSSRSGYPASQTN